MELSMSEYGEEAGRASLFNRTRFSLLGDMRIGAHSGYFAQEIWLPGILTQIVCGFLPVIDVLCAVRDYLADRRKRDRFGPLLNILSLAPIFGGFSHVA